MGLKELRDRLKLKQGELAKKAKISQSYVSKIERGNYLPSTWTTKRIAKALGEDYDKIRLILEAQAK